MSSSFSDFLISPLFANAKPSSRNSCQFSCSSFSSGMLSTGTYGLLGTAEEKKMDRHFEKGFNVVMDEVEPFDLFYRKKVIF